MARYQQVALAEQHLEKLYNIQVPFPEPRPSGNANYSLSYAKPTDISIVGSYSQKTFLRIEDTVSVDLAVTMPSVSVTHFPEVLYDLMLLCSKYFRGKII